MSKYVLLSFDVEEFDMPLEYNFPIPEEEQMKVGKLGLDAILPVIEDISCTMFTTANFALHFPAETRSMAEKHEIASHTFYHAHFENRDLLASRLKLEEITGKPVTGLRMPRLRKVEMEEVKKAGYQYDSSINPTWLPGRYNNLSLPRTLYIDKGMKRLPASVSPNFRIPLFWLAFKNLPYAVFRQLAVQTLKKDGYICLYFHPWEFVDIGQYHLPAYTRRHCGQPLLERLCQLISDLKPYGEFVTIQDWIKGKSPTG